MIPCNFTAPWDYETLRNNVMVLNSSHLQIDPSKKFSTTHFNTLQSLCKFQKKCAYIMANVNLPNNMLGYYWQRYILSRYNGTQRQQTCTLPLVFAKHQQLLNIKILFFVVICNLALLSLGMHMQGGGGLKVCSHNYN